MPKPDVPDVVNHILSAFAMLAMHSTHGAGDPLGGCTMIPMEGTCDDGQKERNAIEVQYATGQRFVIFVASMPPLEETD